MRVALLGTVAWRTPPRAYGPWEQVTGLLAGYPAVCERLLRARRN